MTQNISVSRPVGTDPGGDTFNAFQGTFDGGGYALTFNYTTNAEFCGPFCYTYGATIKNLITTGTINTSKLELDTDENDSYEHVTGFENGTLYLNFKPANTIEAGKPYLIKWENTNEVIENPVFEGVTIVRGEAGSVTSKDNGAETGSVTFVGTYSPTEIFTTDKTNLYMGADNTVYYPWDDGMTSFKVNAFRAYFKLNNGLVCGEPTREGGSINAFVLNFGNGETNTVENSRMAVEDGAGTWFTIDGWKLNTYTSLIWQ